MSGRYDIEFVRQILDDGSGQLDAWLNWIRATGLNRKETSLDEVQIIALAAAIRFSAARRPKAKVLRFIKQLVRESPGGDADWVAVDRPGTSDIKVEPGPFKVEVKGSRRPAPFVFDPYPICERLKDAV